MQLRNFCCARLTSNCAALFLDTYHRHDLLTDYDVLRTSDIWQGGATFYLRYLKILGIRCGVVKKIGQRPLLLNETELMF